MVLPGSVEDAEVTGVLAVSRVSMREGSGLQYTEVWVALRAGELLLFPTDPLKAKERLALSADQHYSTSLSNPLSSSKVLGHPELSLWGPICKSLPRQPQLLCCRGVTESECTDIFMCFFV